MKRRKSGAVRVEIQDIENTEASVSDTSISKKKKRKSRGPQPDEVDLSNITLKTEPEDNDANDTASSLLSDDYSKKKKKKKKRGKDAEDLSADEELTNFEEESKETVNGLIENKKETKDKSNSAGSKNWSKEHLDKLLKQIEAHLPKKDHLKYTSRLTKLDWNMICFDGYSAEECQEVWRMVQSKVRTFRVLKEVVDEAKKYIENNNPLCENHPEMPAKPLSSYMLFQQDVKQKIIAENPGLTIIELSKIISAKWKALSAKKLEKYANRAAQAWQEYEEQKRLFYENHPDIPEPKKAKSKPRSKLDDLGFTKPKSPLQLFLESLREKDPDANQADLLEKCKTKWGNMSEKKKAVWIKAAQEAEEAYRKNLDKYKSEHPDYEAPPMKTLISKRDKNILNHVAGKPQKPPGNAYSLYSRESLQNGSLKEIPSKDRLAEISKRWKALSQPERDSFDTRVKKMINDYKIEYQKYLDTLPPDKRLKEIESSQPKRKRPESKEPQKVKKRKLSEPEKPPNNAYELFKEKNKSQWNSTSASDIERQAKAKWRKLSNADKKSYSEELEKLKSSYITNLSEYLKFCPREKLAEYVNIITSHKLSSTKSEPVVSISSDESESESE